MNRDQKTAVVDEIAGQIEAAEAIFAVDYRGLSVPQAAELRSKLRGADATFRIVKNSLSERAADKAGAEALKPLLEGPTALTLVKGDAALAAKALSDTARLLNILEFKGGMLNGSSVSAEDIRSIARLPSREILQAQLVGTIASPLTGLVRGLSALIGGLAIQLQAIADQGLVAGAAPAGSDSAGSEGEAVASEADTPSEATRTASDEAPAPEGEAELEPELEAAAEPAGEPEAAGEVAEEPEPEAAPEPAEPEAAAEPANESEETEQDAASDADKSDA